ncbi:hypothetical protein HN709_02425 [Candidatus Peregrinibacteria bacterium]|jgi:hypothetical protein|nr:hypothetical protein [Candidatus Peregrinibacteria bacterium]MBT7736518.1 hypothetical protein [Candidatus Peregrinibacteria bacterium]
MKKFKILSALMVGILGFSMFAGVSFASDPGDVVINEVAWAGTSDSSGDEWIELYNPGGAPIDLTGWTLEDDGASNYVIENGEIPARGYFLIEDSEESTSVLSDALIGLSLANSGDSLVLKDDAGFVIDSVNASGGAWYAGDSTSKSSMERIDPIGGDVAENFMTAESGNGATGRTGIAALGTPGSVNSNYDGGGPVISIDGVSTVSTGDTISLSVNVKDSIDLYAYGLDIEYDETFLNYLSIEESFFLGPEGETSFFTALENGNAGKLIVANSRLGDVLGVDGDGTFFTVSFEVVGTDGDSEVSFLSSSFLSDSLGNVPAGYNGITLNVAGAENVDDVSGGYVDQGADRFSLDVIWDYGDADSYLVKKLMPYGSYELLTETTEAFFTDEGIMPGTTYEYLVIPVKNGSEGQATYVAGSDARGLVADFNKDDRVDGKDLEMLARGYGSSFGEGSYLIEVDANYDGVIDGSDLIDFGANFALTF